MWVLQQQENCRVLFESLKAQRYHRNKLGQAWACAEIRSKVMWRSMDLLDFDLSSLKDQDQGALITKPLLNYVTQILSLCFNLLCTFNFWIVSNSLPGANQSDRLRSLSKNLDFLLPHSAILPSRLSLKQVKYDIKLLNGTSAVKMCVCVGGGGMEMCEFPFPLHAVCVEHTADRLFSPWPLSLWVKFSWNSDNKTTQNVGFEQQSISLEVWIIFYPAHYQRHTEWLL